MSHYFNPRAATPSEEKTVAVRFAGIDFQFVTDHDVFSRDHLDTGSEILIRAILADRPPARGRMLDLGCGYGAIGIILKRIYPAIEGVLADVNLRAVELARRNSVANLAKGLLVVESDGLAQVSGSFDMIVCNPPIRAGKAVVQRLFAEARAALRPDGRFYVVIRKQQGAPSAQHFLETLYERVDRIERQAGFWVLRCMEASDATSELGGESVVQSHAKSEPLSVNDA